MAYRLAAHQRLQCIKLQTLRRNKLTTILNSSLRRVLTAVGLLFSSRTYPTPSGVGRACWRIAASFCSLLPNIELLRRTQFNHFGRWPTSRKARPSQHHPSASPQQLFPPSVTASQPTRSKRVTICLKERQCRAHKYGWQRAPAELRRRTCMVLLDVDPRARAYRSPPALRRDPRALEERRPATGADARRPTWAEAPPAAAQVLHRLNFSVGPVKPQEPGFLRRLLE